MFLILLGASVSEPHICSFSGSLSDCVSVCPFVRLPRDHNGHAQQKKHVVELYCYVAHAQHIGSRTIEGEALGKEANNACIAGLNVIENQQDGKTEKTAVGTWRQRIRKVLRAQAI